MDSKMRLVYGIIALLFILILGGCTEIDDAYYPSPEPEEIEKNYVNDVETPLGTDTNDFFIVVEVKGGTYEWDFTVDATADNVTLNSWHGFITILDTRNNIVGKYYNVVGRWPPTGHPHYIETEFHILEEDLQEIYDNIIRYNIKEFNNADIKPDEFPLMPNRVYRVTFNINDTLYTFSYDDHPVVFYQHSYHYGDLSGLYRFHRHLIDFIMNTEEFRSFPQWGWIYLGDWHYNWQGQWYDWLTSRNWP